MGRLEMRVPAALLGMKDLAEPKVPVVPLGTKDPAVLWGTQDTAAL